MSDEPSSTIILFALLGALVSMGVGFVSIYTQIKGQGRQQKADVEAAKAELEKRIRDYLNLKLDNIQMQMNHIKEDIARLEKKINQQKDSYS